MKKQIELSPLILPLPAVLVATYDIDGNPDAMVASWAAPCSQTPPCLGVALRSSRQTYANIIESKAFTINVPDVNQAVPSDYLGLVSAKKNPDKLQQSGFHIAKSCKVNAPIIEECALNIECVLIEKLKIGSHVWMVGEIICVQADETYLTLEGKFNDNGFKPLGYLGASKKYVSDYRIGEAAFHIGNALIPED
ncbi:MAG: flavin reductase family protein [Deltaproteobacteria bacterium]|nr:flavin reductase family protein [Deltaproteobacteria bacterium]